MEDLQLIRRCLAGEKEAFEPLITRYKRLVYSVALNALRNREEAADVAQEVFLKVWSNLWRFDPQYPFKAWIARITLNHCINLNQKKNPQVGWNDDDMERMATAEGMPETETIGKEKRDAVRQAIDKLPEMYRIPIMLYHQQNLSYEEICEVTNSPMSIVKNRIFRARKILAGSLAEYANKQTGKEAMTWSATKPGNT